jgi:hypothetical protein
MMTTHVSFLVEPRPLQRRPGTDEACAKASIGPRQRQESQVSGGAQARLSLTKYAAFTAARPRIAEGLHAPNDRGDVRDDLRGCTSTVQKTACAVPRPHDDG